MKVVSTDGEKVEARSSEGEAGGGNEWYRQFARWSKNPEFDRSAASDVTHSQARSKRLAGIGVASGEGSGTASV